ncbi:MAG: RodZ domain-containing protein [Actinomycetota bacterium]
MSPVAPPSIGPRLRQARIDRSLSIEETAWRTRIRPDLLRALEDEKFESIGHRAFVRRHLSSYARFLGIDPNEVVEDFRSLHEEPEPSPLEELDRKNRGAQKPKRPKWLIAAILSAGAFAAAAAVGALGGQTEHTPPATAVLGTQNVLPTSTPTKAATAGPVTAAEARVRLAVEALASTRVSIIADGGQVFDGTLDTGQHRTFLARSTIDIVAADGGTIRLTVNGAAVGTPGSSGTVFRASYGPHGLINKA